MNLSKFHLADFFQQKLKKWNWSQLLPAQTLLLREFRAGRPHLICAHGGSGKTSAALLALAEYLNPEQDSELERGRPPRTLIITPALISLPVRRDSLSVSEMISAFSSTALNALSWRILSTSPRTKMNWSGLNRFLENFLPGR